MKTVLITGGAGFIGSNIATNLLEKGYDVKIIDSLVTGSMPNIEPILKDIIFTKGDIRNFAFLKKQFRDVDYVIHEAALRSVTRSVKFPALVNEVNIRGTLNVLLAARDTGVKRVVSAASSNVYGDQQKLPWVETMKLNPISPYAVTKVATEAYTLTFHKVWGLETVSLRYFNVFGPRQDPTSDYSPVIPKFVNAMLKNKKPVIFGDGAQTRDFTYIKNTVEGTILAMEKKKAVGEAFNIASGVRISVNQLVNEINNILGKNIKPIYTKPRIGDMKHSFADITKAKKLLGYNVSYPFKKGLFEVIEYFKNE